MTDDYRQGDRETGRFRGFLFVEMATEEQAQAAIAALREAAELPVSRRTLAAFPSV
jgi:RNA recognition motif-containing protein